MGRWVAAAFAVAGLVGSAVAGAAVEARTLQRRARHDGCTGQRLELGWPISANGRFAAFASGASNLVAGDTNRCFDGYRQALQL